MKKLFLFCATAAAVWSLLMLDGRPAHAGMQGNMPTSVQPLPKYPPVVCVATNWATEACEDRQTPLPRANPLRAFNHEPEVPRSGKTTVLYYEPGGILKDHEARFKALAESDDDVEVRSLCGSACTMIMASSPAIESVSPIALRFGFMKRFPGRP